MKRSTLTLITGLTLAAAMTLSAQTRFTSTPTGNKITIEGTSNIHDWTVEGQVISGVMEINKDELLAGKPGKVNCTVTVKIPVRSLKSGKDKMDEVMQEHMSMEKYPMIDYKLSELTVTKGAAGAVECESKGDLVVAGATNKISMPVNVTPLGEKKLKLTGKTAVKMTDYGVQPPVLVGLLSTGDEVKLFFEWMVTQRAATTATK
jgi:polyisoprenoid-binding protein YceI